VTCIYLFINLQKIDQATPSAALAKEKGVVFVVPRFRLGPMGFLPRLLLNDTSSVIKDSTSFQVRLKNSYISFPFVHCQRVEQFIVNLGFSRLVKSANVKLFYFLLLTGFRSSSPENPVKFRQGNQVFFLLVAKHYLAKLSFYHSTVL
jgi:hypothetical protein